MKIQYKASSIMALFGFVIVLLLSWGHEILSHKTVIDKETQNIRNISDEIALHLESNLTELANVAITLSSAPLINNTLLKSNAELALFTDEKRKQEIDSLNQQWMKTNDINDPFIQAYMSNPVAEHLKTQQIILPQRYGEIFLTNRYGVMMATTGKLTTLAHAHKYWWQASYDDGQGRIFLDDRGFDASVEGYVLGVVIPIRNKNEIIGILKCNVNIMGPLSDTIKSFALRHPGKLQIVRTGGLIISEQGISPLSQQVNKELLKLIQKKDNGSSIIIENNEKQLVAFSSIGITLGSEKFAFGGKQESVDHIKGNQGEAWHIIISVSEETVIAESHNITLAIIIIGLTFTLLTAVVALFLGNWIARPIVKLAATAQTLGEGRLETRANVYSNDEIGSLAKSLNTMAKNLQDSMISRDQLIEEVERQTVELVKTKEEAEEANRVKGIFIANMSHEFRTPLTAVLGFSQEMLTDQTLSVKYRDYLNIIHRNGRLQLSLINDVLAMLKLEDGRTRLKLEAFDLNKLIEDVVDKGLLAARTKNITLNVDYTSEIPQFINSDYEKLQQILNILIENAIKYTESGEISLRFFSEQSENDDVVVFNCDIEDSGVGIPAKFQGLIFQPFFQLGEQDDKTGTGLGLTLAKRFLGLMGGEISLESELGRGTVFHISLPVKLATEVVFGVKALAKHEMIEQTEQPKEEDLQFISRELGSLADETISELADAVVTLDIERVLTVVRHIEPHRPELAGALVTMVNNFNFKILQRLLGTLKNHQG
ncbi:MAG: HAMP domain-containing protein [gamma proteobacterium symbiont of Taylorina sp.]|nr:HAMP domain-containing protein [gamma proteobacterium symbiont of Taylorina sp.]